MGFELAFREDFENGLSPEWSVYGNTPDGKYTEDFVLVSQGAKLQLQTARAPDKWRSGGMALMLPSQVYGSYRVQVRLQAGHHFRGVALLWPDGGWEATDTWEVDFLEIGGKDEDRVKNTQTLHYPPDNRMHHTDYVLEGSDFTEWHNVRLDWTPGRLAYGCDGSTRAEVREDYVPDLPMHLALQTGVMKPDSGLAPTDEDPIGVMIVDWVEVYRWSP